MPTIEDLLWLAIGTAYVLVGVILVCLSKFVMDWLTPYKVDEELTRKDNPALGVATAGYFASVIVIYLGATAGEAAAGPGQWAALATELGIDVLYALGGIAALMISRVVLDRLVLHRFSMRKEIIADRNVGAGAVEAGMLLAGALVVAGAVHGEGSPLTAVVFFAAGQAVLVLFGRVYQWITRYDIHKEIESDNVAAGVAMGLSLVAIGVVLLKATAGHFAGWAESLGTFGLYAAAGFVVLTVLRKVIDWVLLPGTTIAREIATDRSSNAAYVEGTMSIGVAAMVLFLF